MPKLSPEEGARKYAAKASAASGDFTAGVGRVTESPGAAAVRNRARWEAKLNDAATREKWARNTGAVSTESWRRNTIEKGGSRYAQGVQQAETKVAERNRELYAHIQAGEDRLRSMPKVTLEDGVNRATAMIRHMASYRRGGTTGTR